MKNLIITLVSIGVLVTSGVVLVNIAIPDQEDLTMEFSNEVAKNQRASTSSVVMEKSLPKSTYSQRNTSTAYSGDLISNLNSVSTITPTKSGGSIGTSSFVGNSSNNAVTVFAEENTKSQRSNGSASVGGGMSGPNALGLYAVQSSRSASDGIGSGGGMISARNNLKGTLAGDTPFITRAEEGEAAADGTSVSPGDVGVSLLEEELPITGGIGILLVMVGIFLGHKVIRTKYSC